MTASAGLLMMSGQLPIAESYIELLGSGPHWLFELTLELLTAPLAFIAGRLWRTGVLRHLHRDLHALAQDEPGRRRADGQPTDCPDG